MGGDYTPVLVSTGLTHHQYRQYKKVLKAGGMGVTEDSCRVGEVYASEQI